MLRVEELRTHIFTRWGAVRAVDGVSFELERGEALGIVGESGSGKSLACLSLLRLLPQGAKVVGGSVRLDGENLLALPLAAMRRIRGRRISMIQQDPMTSLNPVMSIGSQVKEPIRIHQPDAKARLADRVTAALRAVHIPSPAMRARDFPHQLSGGMRQRVGGAIALSCQPDLLIADEPTTALDVTIQAQYLELLDEIRAKHRVAIIFVTHDLGIVARLCQRVAVMYAGRIVETAPVERLFDAPAHPYSQALLAAVPRGGSRSERLATIAGQPPSPRDPVNACAFAPRCPKADRRCREAAPPELHIAEGHRAACWKPDHG